MDPHPLPFSTLEGPISRMRVSPLMTRILIALLTLRVLAAPVAARPDTPHSPSAHRFIVRICAWPAQRPQRATAVAILLPGSRGTVPDPRTAAIRATTLRDLSRSALSRLAAPSVRDATAHRVIDSPRC